jgi:hypothetical protein
LGAFDAERHKRAAARLDALTAVLPAMMAQARRADTQLGARESALPSSHPNATAARQRTLLEASHEEVHGCPPNNGPSCAPCYSDVAIIRAARAMLMRPAFGRMLCRRRGSVHTPTSWLHSCGPRRPRTRRRADRPRAADGRLDLSRTSTFAHGAAPG